MLFRSDMTPIVLDFHLLGIVDLATLLALQRRLVEAAIDGTARTVPVLFCEHPQAISLGRGGSRAHIRLESDQLERRGIGVDWVSRGGGCVLHAPGQLAIYPILAPNHYGWTLGEYGRRLQGAFADTIRALRLPVQTRSTSLGVWGQRGLLAAIGLKVEQGVAHYGGYLNVAPDMSLFGFVDCVADPPAGTSRTMSCLMAERRGPVPMTSVRSLMIAHLSQQFACEEHHIHSGHPWLAPHFSGRPEHRSGDSRRPEPRPGDSRRPEPRSGDHRGQEPRSGPPHGPTSS